MKEFAFVVDVPGEAPFIARVQEDSEEVARRDIEARLAVSYLARDGVVGALLEVTDG